MFPQHCQSRSGDCQNVTRLMPNLHRPPDKTRRSCLRRVRRCELSLETVWQSLDSQPIDHPRRLAFSEEILVWSYATVHRVSTFSWHTTSLRVGGRAARRSCLPGLRRGGGGRQAFATVLSCLVWRCEFSRPDCPTAAFCVCSLTVTKLRTATGTIVTMSHKTVQIYTFS